MTDVVRSEWFVRASVIARLREPRRLAAIVLLGVTGGLVLALIYSRGQLAGSDAFAYWTAVQRWLSGADIYQVQPGLYVPPTEGALPFAYPPWSLYLFLPWALLPWDFAWMLWRVAIIGLFALSVAWAYERRPLGTAVFVTLLAPSLAANLDTGNINVLIALGIWVAWLDGKRFGGALWALGTALKWIPGLLLVFLPRRAWPWGLAALGVLVVLTLATWPQTLRQIEIALEYPRPFRLDYLLLVWAAVPWLYSRPWPPRLSREWLAGPDSTT